MVCGMACSVGAEARVSRSEARISGAVSGAISGAISISGAEVHRVGLVLQRVHPSPHRRLGLAPVQGAKSGRHGLSRKRDLPRGARSGALPSEYKTGQGCAPEAERGRTAPPPPRGAEHHLASVRVRVKVRVRV